MKIDANGSPADVRLLQNLFEQVFKETLAAGCIRLPSYAMAGEGTYQEMASDSNARPLSRITAGSLGEIEFKPGDCVELNGVPVMFRPEVPRGQIWLGISLDGLRYSGPTEVIVENIGGVP